MQQILLNSGRTNVTTYVLRSKTKGQSGKGVTTEARHQVQRETDYNSEDEERE